MSKELVISANRHETRVALLEDDQLVEVYFQRANEYSLAGSIHKGRVTRVLPGMQSAFVDLGLERDTFLYVSDFLEEEHEDIDRVTGDERPPRESGRENRPGSGATSAAIRAPQETAAPAPAAVRREVRPATPKLYRQRGPSDVEAARSQSAEGASERPTGLLGLRPDRMTRRPPRTPLAPPPQSRTRIPRIEIRRGRTRRRAPAAAAPVETEPAATAGRRARPSRHGSAGRNASRQLRWFCPASRWPSIAAVRIAAVEPPPRSMVPPPLPTEEGGAGRADRTSRLRGAHPLSAGERPAGRSRALGAGRVAVLHRTCAGAAALPLPPLSEEAVSEQEAADLEDAAQSGPVTAPMLDEDEDRDIQAMILGEARRETRRGFGRRPAEPIAKKTAERREPEPWRAPGRDRASPPVEPRKSANGADAFRIASRAVTPSRRTGPRSVRTTGRESGPAEQAPRRPRAIPSSATSVDPAPRATVAIATRDRRKCSRSPSPTC